MRYRVVLGEGGGGVFEAPLSRTACLAALSVLGSTGGRVRVSRGIALLFNRFYRALGYESSVVGDELVVEPTRPRRPVNARITAPCDPVTIAFMALVSGVAAPLGSRIIIGARCSWIIEHDLTPLLEAASSIGFRVWRTGSPSTLLVVEPTAANPSAYRRLVRLVGVVPGYVLAAVLTTLSWRSEESIVVVSGTIDSRIKVKTVADVLAGMGAGVSQLDEHKYSVRGLDGPVDYRVPGGYVEALAILASRGGEATNLPEKLGGLEELVDYHRALGVIVERDCEKGFCRLRRIGAEPRSATVTVAEEPDTLTSILPSIVYLKPGSATIAGMRAAEREGINTAWVTELLSIAGAETVMEEDRVIVTGWRLEEKELETSIDRVECRQGFERPCLATALALSTNSRVEVLLERDPDEAMPGLLRALEQAGVRVRVERV